MASTICPRCGNLITAKDVCILCGFDLNISDYPPQNKLESDSTISKRTFSLHHYLVLGAGILLVLILYNLPRHVIDSNRNLSTKTENSQQNANLDPKPALVEMPVLIQTILDTDSVTANLIRDMEKEFKNENEQERKLKLAENLSKAYITIKYFKAAAPLLWNLAIEKKEAQSWSLAGKSFQDANQAETDSLIITENLLKSRQAFSKALEMEPENSDYKIELALLYINGSQPMQGISLLKEVLEKDPAHEKAGLYLGIFSMQTGQYDKAISRFEEILKHHPENLEVCYYQALAYHYLGNSEKSVSLLAHIKEKSKDPQLLAMTEQLENIIKENKSN